MTCLRCHSTAMTERGDLIHLWMCDVDRPRPLWTVRDVFVSGA